MGLAKDRWERGLSFVDESVCAQCFDDPGLKDYIEGIACDLRCDFCGRESDSEPIAAPVDSVVDYMDECISREYEDPRESVGWCSEDGGWGIEPFSTSELLSWLGGELALELPNDDGRLLDALCTGLGGDREWVHRNPYFRTPEEVYAHSWDGFSEIVKHHRRFFFLNHRQTDDLFNELLPPQELLRRLAEFCVSQQLVRVFPPGTPLYRVRKAPPGKKLTTALDLGPPPPDCARFPTRMSPAGISMFYDADDPDTALWETWDEPASYVTGCFEATRDILILDLTHVPRIPSLFEPVSDTAESDPRYALMFLHMFTEAMSSPIDRKERPHIDYVPTQVVSEYFRCFALEDGRRLNGIRYTSAQRPPYSCCVLFAGRDQVIPSEDDKQRYRDAERGHLVSNHDGGWLRLVNSSEQLVPNNPVARPDA